MAIVPFDCALTCTPNCINVCLMSYIKDLFPKKRFYCNPELTNGGFNKARLLIRRSKRWSEYFFFSIIRGTVMINRINNRLIVMLESHYLSQDVRSSLTRDIATCHRVNPHNPEGTHLNTDHKRDRTVHTRKAIIPQGPLQRPVQCIAPR